MRAVVIPDADLFELNDKIGDVCGALNQTEAILTMQTPEYEAFTKIQRAFVEFMHLFQEKTK